MIWKSFQDGGSCSLQPLFQDECYTFILHQTKLFFFTIYFTKYSFCSDVQQMAVDTFPLINTNNYKNVHNVISFGMKGFFKKIWKFLGMCAQKFTTTHTNSVKNCWAVLVLLRSDWRSHLLGRNGLPLQVLHWYTA